ncbi:tetratricopeptide repeat protein [Flavobacteriaceae bacterium]|nr:tetratricopeptide repeat protein [Flavobacteriaceae bacterium]
MKVKLILFYLIVISIDGLAQTPQDNYNKSILFEKQKQYDHALKSVNKAIKGSEVPVEDFWYLKFKILMKKNDLGSLKETLDSAIVQLPNSIKLLEERTEYSVLVNDFRQAALDLKKLISLKKEYKTKEHMLNLAGLYFKSKKIDESLEIVKSILADDPQNTQGILVLASILTEKKQYLNAIQLFESILHSDVENILINLGYVYQKLNNNGQAIELFEHSLKINDQNPYALSNLAKSKLAIGATEEAMVIVNKSIKILPNNAYAIKVKGEIYLRMNNKEQACFEFIVARNLGYDNQFQDSILDIMPLECVKLTKALFK